MKYHTLLFDMDDTLFDFRRAEAEALRQTLLSLGQPFAPAYEALYAACNQQVWREFERGEVSAVELRVRRFRLFFERLGLPAAPDPQAVSPVYLRFLGQGAFLLPGAEELITALRPLCRLALVTNGLSDVQRPRLAASSLVGRFDGLFISEEIGFAKPSPAYFDFVFTALGLQGPEGVLLIGDSLTSDMQGGLNCGIDTCWYNPRALAASLPVTTHIQRLDQLLPWLQS